MRLRSSCALLLAASGLAVGCAGTDDDGPPGLAYAEASASEFPRVGASLDETLRSIVPRRTTNALVQARDVRLVRIDGDAWQEVPVDEASAAVAAAPANARWAVAVSLNCQARANRNRFHGEKVAWYLLPNGKLAAWDHWEFGDACSMFDQFKPARRDGVKDEQRLLQWIGKTFPPSITHVNEIYAKGIAYVQAGRLDDAQAMLSAGDAAFDVTADQKINTREGVDKQYTGDRGALRGARDNLVSALEKARAAEQAPVAAPPP